jgi:hypothetical protein
MLLSLDTANAQCFQWGSLQVCPDNTRPRECDLHGCYFDDLKRWRALNPPGALQNDLQRRAEEMREELERKMQRERQNSK